MVGCFFVGDVVHCDLNALRFRSLGCASWMNPLCSVQRGLGSLSFIVVVILLLSSNEIRLWPWWKKSQNSESSHFPNLNSILQMGPEQKYGLTLVARKMKRINTLLEKQTI